MRVGPYSSHTGFANSKLLNYWVYYCTINIALILLARLYTNMGRGSYPEQPTKDKNISIPCSTVIPP
ncbi:hypothetical protein BDR04DRAFT_791567 [Suillus decipiens]|nr:hypothetical protein BDR04DRAFT_791567 [Suillus decipiens]